MSRLPPIVERLSPLVLVVGLLAFAARGMCTRRGDNPHVPVMHEPGIQVAGVGPMMSPVTLLPAPGCIPSSQSPNVTFLQCAPPISATAGLPHPDRGPCENCHRIKPSTTMRGPIVAPTVAPTRDVGQMGTNARSEVALVPTPAAASAPADGPLVTTPLVVAAPAPVATAPLAVDAPPVVDPAPVVDTAPVVVTLPPNADPPVTAKPWDWTAATTAGQPGGDTLPFMEGHWQGLEVVPLWAPIAAALGIATDVEGVLVDEVTQPANGQGFAAGDVVMAVGGIATPSVETFLVAADQVRDAASVEVRVLRDGQPLSLILTAMSLRGVKRLGTANGETAPMIPPGIPRPHADFGPCTNCHPIGTNGGIPIDPGTWFPLTAPTIKAGTKNPHEDRGPCKSCHVIN